MHEDLKATEERYRELERLLADHEVLSDKNQYQQYAKELSSITELVKTYREYKRISSEKKGLEELLSEKQGDKDFLELAKKEVEQLGVKEEELNSTIEKLTCEEEKGLDRDVIVEIRAGTGGLEASLFAADLYRMYNKFSSTNNWNVEVMNSHPTEAGGFKEVVFSIKGKEVYRKMRYESGVHRVQRVPATEASGRIHTSTATVAVLVEPEEVDFKIDPKDLKIDVFRSSGPGGQSVNTTDSAIRITYLPTGMVVICQDERSQLKNKHKAMRVLRARLLDEAQRAEKSKITEERRSQIGTGERSEKIRTYNFPDRRVTDHRINFTIHRLEAVLEGNLDEVVNALTEEDKKRS